MKKIKLFRLKYWRVTEDFQPLSRGLDTYNIPYAIEYKKDFDMPWETRVNGPRTNKVPIENIFGNLFFIYMGKVYKVRNDDDLMFLSLIYKFPWESSIVTEDNKKDKLYFSEEVQVRINRIMTDFGYENKLDGARLNVNIATDPEILVEVANAGHKELRQFFNLKYLQDKVFMTENETRLLIICLKIQIAINKLFTKRTNNGV